jgi:hypothetical protein
MRSKGSRPYFPMDVKTVAPDHRRPDYLVKYAWVHRGFRLKISIQLKGLFVPANPPAGIGWREDAAFSTEVSHLQDQIVRGTLGGSER